MDGHQVLHQQGYAVRSDWGLAGALGTAGAAAYAVVVDVLSFTTSVCVGVDAGMRVHPYPWADPNAEEFARSRDATLAVGRSRARPGEVSLSPVSIAAARGVERLVLPSPNGSTIAAGLAGTGATVLAGCLRNRRAVAGWLLERVGPAAVVCVVAAGERWPDGSLRPAVEDLWGAGAVLEALREGGLTGLSPEADASAAAFRAVAPRLEEALLGCASGRELVARGFSADVALAAALDASAAVPVLGADGAFQPAPR